jgi:serine protease AprX
VVKPDLLAPGDSLASLRSPLSFLDRWFPENRVGSTSHGAGDPEYFRLSGTSMAAAMVSGVAALMLSQEPGLTPDDLKARLMRSAEKGPWGIFTQGAGSVDAMAALESGGAVLSSASARTLRDELTVHVLESTPWGESTGLEDVYGAASLWDASAVWDLEALWSDGSDADEQVVWQVPTPAESGRDRAWQRIPDAASQSVVWQLVDSPRPGGAAGDAVGGESVVWQGRPGKGQELAAESVVWQGRPGNGLQPTDDFLSSESVVWQGRPQKLGGPTDELLTAESVVWQQTDGLLRILIQGDQASAP